MVAAISAIPRTFIWRRLHSLAGLWFVLFLCEHLLTNSQAALWLGDNGRGFRVMVDAIHNLPYLEVIEITLLGIPILLHAILGVKYLFTAKINSQKSDGSQPYIPLPRNRAYTWQRITSWILLFLLAFHIVKFRFLEYPEKVSMGKNTYYLIKVSMDEGLYTVADRLGVKLYDRDAVAHERSLVEKDFGASFSEQANRLRLENSSGLEEYDVEKARIFGGEQSYREKVGFAQALQGQRISREEVVAVATDFGTASVLAVRDTFKSPFYIGLYTVFVIAACFHACNGFWTFLLTWGWILKKAAQNAWTTVATVMMAILIFLGLAAVWGTYWINLRS